MLDEDDDDNDEDDDADVVKAGRCMVDEINDDALPIRFSPPPSVPSPSPPVPPLRVSLKSWGSMVDLSRAEVVGVCMVLFALLPLGIPTKWLWFEWLVNRSFISS